MNSGKSKSRFRPGWWWKWGRWLVVPLILGAIVYQMRLAPVTVQGNSPIRRSIVAEVMGTGTLEARVSTTISPKIAGRINQVLVDQGDMVEQDQLLVGLDDEELQQQVEIAKANLEAAEAALQRLMADKNRAIAVFEQAQRHQVRVQSLKEENVVSQDDVDRSVESLAVATADLTRAEAAIREGQKGHLAAEKTLEYHRARLADTTIKAPFAGVVVARQREAGDIAVPGSAVLTLISTEVLMELLDYLGVADRAGNLPSMLSGGQQQRVAVARALANRPSVILADEPTAALDSHRGRQVMELFAKVAHEQQAAVIVVTHDHRSLDVFDTHFEMEDGRLSLSNNDHH